MKSLQQKALITASSVAMLLALGACGRTDDQTTAGQKMDSAVSAGRQAGAEVKQDAKNATASAGAAVSNAAQDTKAMGATAGEKIDDASITAKVNASLATDKDLSAIKIDVDTQNGVVTLSGPAPSATARERASEIARGVKGVSSVNNQLTGKAG
jgi:hyperosmotically inducible periplasmic protein